MVVVTGQSKASATPDDAMSSSDAEDDFQEPATPTATQAGQALPLLPQQVRAHLGWGWSQHQRCSGAEEFRISLTCLNKTESLEFISAARPLYLQVPSRFGLETCSEVFILVLKASWGVLVRF